MDEDQWMYDSMMSEEVDINIKNEEDVGVKVEHVDCSDAFNTSQLFACRDEVLQWAQSLAHDIGFVVVIMRYKLSLLDIVGVTPTRMTLSVGFAYLEEERLNNVVWTLQRFRGLFMRVDAFLRVIVTDKDFSLMNAVKTVFPDATNLLCRFHVDKIVKAKYKTLVAQKNACDYVMEVWGSLIDYPCENSFDEYLKNFEMTYSS
ncbi:hypothetical protein HKD37_12G034773 [Glycine soja]